MPRRVVAAGGAGPLAVGAPWRRSALLVVAGVLVLAPWWRWPAPGRWEPPAGGAGPSAGALLAGADALAGAVGGLLAGLRAVDALAARVVRLLEAKRRPLIRNLIQNGFLLSCFQ